MLARPIGVSSGLRVLAGLYQQGGFQQHLHLQHKGIYDWLDFLQIPVDTQLPASRQAQATAACLQVELDMFNVPIALRHLKHCLKLG